MMNREDFTWRVPRAGVHILPRIRNQEGLECILSSLACTVEARIRLYRSIHQKTFNRELLEPHELFEKWDKEEHQRLEKDDEFWDSFYEIYDKLEEIWYEMDKEGKECWLKWAKKEAAELKLLDKEEETNSDEEIEPEAKFLVDGLLDKVSAIQTEIKRNGPILVELWMDKGFDKLGDQIYEVKGKKLMGKTKQGVGFNITHSVMAVGWGIENGEQYLVVQNSYGQSWGECGFCRVKPNAIRLAIAPVIRKRREIAGGWDISDELFSRKCAHCDSLVGEPNCATMLAESGQTQS